jgi:hypothetical protein
MVIDTKYKWLHEPRPVALGRVSLITTSHLFTPGKLSSETSD